MTEYAIVDDGQIVGFKQLDTPPEVLKGKPYRKVLPVEVTDPAVDGATQIKEGPVVTVLADKVTRVWSVRSKTAQELDDEKTTQATGYNGIAFKIALNHENRLRTLEGKAAVTAAQFRTAIKALL
jgi:hypothetical protein